MKFIENPKHLFECVTPPPPDEIREYEHPDLPIKCDDLGVFYFNFPHEINPEWLIYADGLDRITVNKNYDVHLSKLEWQRIWKGKKFHGKASTISLGNRTALMYECFTHNLIGSTHINHFNHNPWDCRKENLFSHHEVPTEYPHRVEWTKERAMFLNETTKEINKRIIKYHSRGCDPLKWLELIKLPNLYMQHWKKHKEEFGLPKGILDYWGDL